MTATNIVAGTLLASQDGYRVEVYGIITGPSAVPGVDCQIALLAGSDGTKFEYPVMFIVGMVARGAWSVIEHCPSCGSEKFAHAAAGIDGEYLNICAGCLAVWSDNLSAERSYAVVKGMGSDTRGFSRGAGREYYFDFSDAARTYRRHGYAANGVCVQIG